MQGVHWCDKRRSVSEYTTLFPAIDFSLASSFLQVVKQCPENELTASFISFVATANRLCVTFTFRLKVMLMYCGRLMSENQMTKLQLGGWNSWNGDFLILWNSYGSSLNDLIPKIKFWKICINSNRMIMREGLNCVFYEKGRELNKGGLAKKRLSARLWKIDFLVLLLFLTLFCEIVQVVDTEGKGDRNCYPQWLLGSYTKCIWKWLSSIR